MVTKILNFKFILLLFLLLLIRFFYATKGIKESERLLKSIPDAAEYHALAVNLSLGEGFKRDGDFETVRTPLLPLLLSLFYKFNPSVFINFYLNILFSILILIYAYNNLRGKSFYFFSLFFIFSPNLNFNSLFPTADFLFGVLVFFLYASIIKQKLFFIILILSLLPYLKPVGLLLPPVISLYFLLKKSFKHALFVLILPTFISFFWVINVYIKTGYFGFSGIVPVNFFAYYVPFAVSLKDKISFSEAREKLSEKLTKRLPPNYKVKDLYYAMLSLSFDELKGTFPSFLVSHTIFSLNTLFSPISFRPLIVYLRGEEIKKPFQQEFFKLLLSGNFLEGFRKFFSERIALFGLDGLLILFFSLFYNSTLILLFLCKALKKREEFFLIFLILFPLIFSTGVLGEARFRVLFEILLIYFTFI
ncbi:MAG: hypothetical protein ABDH49_05735 [Candidatus Hydrothermales bacterium]